MIEPYYETELGKLYSLCDPVASGFRAAERQMKRMSKREKKKSGEKS